MSQYERNSVYTENVNFTILLHVAAENNEDN